MTTLLHAFGSYGIAVQDRAIMANPHDHPTEGMVFRGARFALLEETPERGRLDVNKLKKVAGTPRMSGRYIGKDVIEWDTTHTLIVNTNYDPLVEETDHGVWRRLTMMPFDRTYRGLDLDTTLRPRLLAKGSHGMKAALAWVVAGAVAYHQGGRTIPEPTDRMRTATNTWRNDNDHLGAFIDEYLVIEGPASKSAILSTDLVATFGEWMRKRGHHAWGDSTIAQRMKGHHLLEGQGVVKAVKRTASLSLSVGPDHLGVVPIQAKVWMGLRWGDDADLP
jgi:putative DNA primase/helicase